MQKRICEKCKIEKNLETDFYRQTTQVVHKGKIYYWRSCKLCCSTRTANKLRENYKNNIPLERAKARAKYRRYMKLGKRQEYEKRDQERYPEKHKARRFLRDEVKAGRVKKENCKVCQSPKTEGHHPDYSKPLEVIWFCSRHHAEEHRRMRILKTNLKENK